MPKFLDRLVWYNEDGNLEYDFRLQSFADASWATIDAYAKSGIYKLAFKVGAEKSFQSISNKNYTVTILGFDHDDISDGSGKAKIIIGMTTVGDYVIMDSVNYEVSCWRYTDMRQTTMVNLFEDLPFDSQEVIKEVKKYSIQWGVQPSNPALDTTNDKLWLLSKREITNSLGDENERTQYEYWRTIKNGATPAGGVKRSGPSTSATALDWRVRTMNDTELDSSPQTNKSIYVGVRWKF